MKMAKTKLSMGSTGNRGTLGSNGSGSLNTASTVGFNSEQIPTGRERVKLEAAENEILKLKGDFVALREENVALMTSNEIQKDKVNKNYDFHRSCR